MRAGVVIVAAVGLVGAGIAALQHSGLLDRTASAPPPATPIQALRIANVMVIADDAVVGGIARANRVAENALTAFEAQLRAAGLTVHDGRAVLVVNPALDNEKRPDSELLLLARRQQPRIDAVIVFSVLTPIDATMQAQNAAIRGSARILSGVDGRALAAAEWTSPMRWTLPYACDRACLIDTVGVEAPAVVAALAERVVAGLK
ncbi:MAG: hypothetical protein FJX64_07065 [Alphaproteobacteria bacterium]|nr:hypothetical protein [Alphaproteobacteria bacterium]